MPTTVDRLRLNADLMRLVRERATLQPGQVLARVRNASAMAETLAKLGVQPPLPVSPVSIYNSGTDPTEPRMDSPEKNKLIARLLPVYAKHGDAIALVREIEAAGNKPTGPQKAAITRTRTELENELERYTDYGRKPEGAPTVAELAQAYDAKVAAAKAEREELAGQPTLSVDELTAKAFAALDAKAKHPKNGTREAKAETMVDGAVITAVAADDLASRYIGAGTKRTIRFLQDGKVVSKESLLRLIGGKARQEINEVLRAAFEAQAPSLEADYKSYIHRVFDHQKEVHGGKLPAYPAHDDPARAVILETIVPHSRKVDLNPKPAGEYVYGHKSDWVLELDEAKLAETAKKYGEEAAVQWFYKTNEKLGRLEHAELHFDRGGDVVVTGERAGKKVSMSQQRILKWSINGKPFHQFPARLYVDGKFHPEAIYQRLFKADKPA